MQYNSKLNEIGGLAFPISNKLKTPYGLQRSLLIEYLHYNFCDYDAMMAIQSIVVYLIKYLNDKTLLHKREKLSIDTPEILTTGVKYYGNDAFIIKKYTNSKIMNFEMFIGLHINTLRKIIPNFMFTMCDINDGVVLELIKGVSLKEVLVKNILPEIDVQKIYLQVAFSLQIAAEHFDFIHQDLHAENIIIRTLRFPINLRYQINNTVYFITTKYIATIIDFGLSNFKISDQRYGIFENEKYNLSPNNLNHFVDLFKLISYSNFHRKTHYNDTFNILNGFFPKKIFTDHSNYDRLLGKTKKLNYYYPTDKDFNISLGPKSFINYLMKTPISNLVTKQPKKGYIACKSTNEKFSYYLESLTTSQHPDSPLPCTDFNYYLNNKKFYYNSYGVKLYPTKCLKKLGKYIILPEGYSIYASLTHSKYRLQAPLNFFIDYETASWFKTKYNVQAYIIKNDVVIDGKIATYNSANNSVTFNDDAFKYIERDYDNRLDWQYMDMNRLFGEIKKLVVNMIDNDEYESAIWGALYMKDLLSSKNYPKQMNKILIISVFLYSFEGVDTPNIILGSKQSKIIDIYNFFENVEITNECRYMVAFFMEAGTYPSKYKQLLEKYGIHKNDKWLLDILKDASKLVFESIKNRKTPYVSPDYDDKREIAIKNKIPNTDINSRLPYYNYISNV